MQVDNELLSDMDEIEGIYSQYGLQALQQEFDTEASAGGVNRVFFKLISPESQTLAASDLSRWQTINTLTEDFTAIPEGREFATVSLEADRYKARVITNKIAAGYVFQIGATLRDNQVLLEQYKQTFWIVFTFMLLVGSFVGWLMAKHAMAGVKRITKTASQISHGNLMLRVKPGNEGLEIMILAETFNQMLERIELLIREMKDVSNNIAHDLRSPITRIRGISETTLSGDQNLAAYQKMSQDIIAESDRFIVMINTMLDIAQTESGVIDFSQVPVNMEEIINDAYQLFLPVALDKNICLTLNLLDKPLVVIGDRSRLQRLIANLIDNALKYTLSGGMVKISASRNSSRVIIEVADTGIGIDQSDLPQVFNRFYRSDKSRSLSGNGLGLCLAQSIAKAHKGEITAASIVDKGSKFTVFLPLSS
ncbi:MAG: HAMP domain-containing histidine kinase [Candidatus Omnitrophica bacterium]|nr:HAMP domain-containing histidine kinase [Candidatus Omnitrophota bacterium]